MSNSPVKTSKFLRKCAEIQETHWFLSLLIVKLSAVWYSLVIGFAGETCRLVFVTTKGTKALTFWGWVSSITILGLIVLGEASTKYMKMKTPPKFEIGAYQLLLNLRAGIDSFCNSKYRSLVSKIDTARKKRDDTGKKIEGRPIEEIDILAHEMEKCLKTLLEEDKKQPKDIFVSIIYQLPQEDKNKWYWGIKDEKGLSLDELLAKGSDGRKSTVRHLLDNKGHFVFYNSKAKAYEEKKYITDDWDNLEQGEGEQDLRGSIACYEGFVKRNDIFFIKYVIMISTYKSKFSECEDSNIIKNIKGNIHDFVISDFETRIQNELCTFYLGELEATQS